MKHPDLEQVAAFAEGRLAGEDRERMVEHLASCDDCHELLVETVELLRPDGDAIGTTDGDAGRGTATVLRPRPGRWRRRLPLIAAAAAAALVAFLVWTPAGKELLSGPRHAALVTPPSDLVRPLGGGELLSALERPAADWNETLGPSPSVSDRQAADFRLGVHNAELAAALAVLAGSEPPGATVTAARVAARVRAQRILASLPPGVGASVRTLYGRLIEDLEAGASAAELRDLHDQADRSLAPDPEVDSPGFVDGDDYALGKWAGTARLALDGGRPGWFRSPLPHRQMEALAGARFPEPVVAPLAEVVEAVDGDPDALDLPRLRAALTRLLQEAGDGEGPEQGGAGPTATPGVR